jgi:hypothetical protein
MTRRDVTSEQAGRISKALYPATNYLARLRRRMESRGFPHTDPLYLLVRAAHEAVNRLRLDTHYIACGVGEPGRDGHGPPPTLGR